MQIFVPPVEDGVRRPQEQRAQDARHNVRALAHHQDTDRVRPLIGLLVDQVGVGYRNVLAVEPELDAPRPGADGVGYRVRVRGDYGAVNVLADLGGEARRRILPPAP